MESLYLSDNLIEDIRPLSGLPLLNALELQNNSIRDLTPIRGHDALEYLDVRGNPIEVFAGVESMGIDTLYMDAPGT